MSEIYIFYSIYKLLKAMRHFYLFFFFLFFFSNPNYAQKIRCFIIKTSDNYIIVKTNTANFKISGIEVKSKPVEISTKQYAAISKGSYDPVTHGTIEVEGYFFDPNFVPRKGESKRFCVSNSSNIGEIGYWCSAKQDEDCCKIIELH